MMWNYSDAVWSHFLRPRRVGAPIADEAGVTTGLAGSADENALIELSLTVVENTVRAARFRAYGCGVTIACGAWVADWVEGKTLDDVADLDSAAIAAALALPALKIRCAVVAEQALRAALDPHSSDKIL